MSSAPLIEFNNVTRTFGSGDKTVTSVDDVILRVDRGEVLERQRLGQGHAPRITGTSTGFRPLGRPSFNRSGGVAHHR